LVPACRTYKSIPSIVRRLADAAGRKHEHDGQDEAAKTTVVAPQPSEGPAVALVNLVAKAGMMTRFGASYLMPVVAWRWAQWRGLEALAQPTSRTATERAAAVVTAAATPSNARSRLRGTRRERRTSHFDG